MKTTHLFTDSCTFSSEMKSLTSVLQTNVIRAVECGRGIVLLPDTNRKRECSEGELLKALHIKKDGNNIQIQSKKTADDEKKDYLFSINNEAAFIIGLNPAQISLLDFLAENDYLWDSVSYSPYEGLDRIEI